MTDEQKTIAHAIWQAQASNSIGRTNTHKRSMRAGMVRVAEHISHTLSPDVRVQFMHATGLYMG